MNTIEIPYNQINVGDKVDLGKKDGAQTVKQINLWGRKTPASCHEVIFESGHIYVGWGERKLNKVE